MRYTHVLRRSCAGCSRSVEPSELIRLFLSQERRVDVSRGEGDWDADEPAVYICPRISCLREAMRRGLFGHALFQQVGPLDEGGLAARVADRTGEWILRMLYQGHCEGAVVPLHSRDGWAGPAHLFVLGEPGPATEVPTVVVGPRRMLAIALQTQDATCAAVLDEVLARELARWSAIRAEFHSLAAGKREGELAERQARLHPTH